MMRTDNRHDYDNNALNISAYTHSTSKHKYIRIQP